MVKCCLLQRRVHNLYGLAQPGVCGLCRRLSVFVLHVVRTYATLLEGLSVIGGLPVGHAEERGYNIALFCAEVNATHCGIVLKVLADDELLCYLFQL